MSGALAVRHDIAALEVALNDALATGHLLAAYTTYYDEAALTGGLADVPSPDWHRVRVLRFLHWAERFHGAIPARCAAGKRVSRSEWVVPARSGAAAVPPCQRVVTRHWRQGRVIDERIQDRDASRDWGRRPDTHRIQE